MTTNSEHPSKAQCPYCGPDCAGGTACAARAEYGERYQSEAKPEPSDHTCLDNHDFPTGSCVICHKPMQPEPSLRERAIRETAEIFDYDPNVAVLYMPQGKAFRYAVEQRTLNYQHEQTTSRLRGELVKANDHEKYWRCAYCWNSFGPYATQSESLASIAAHITNLTCPEHPVAKLEATIAELRQALQEEWLFNHRCSNMMPYCDDGEMQCCMIDFKRMPFNELREAVKVLRIKNAEALHRKGNPND